jgi:hypothetical protein
MRSVIVESEYIISYLGVIRGVQNFTPVLEMHNILVLTYVFCLAENIRRINNIISYEARILQSYWLATV